MEDKAKLAARTALAKNPSIPDKYGHIDFRPPVEVAEAASRGLAYRQKASPSNKGGLTPEEAAKEGVGSGVQRATNLKNRDNVSPEVIGQMRNFLSRSERASEIEEGKEPWNDKGYVAWLLWGGNPGKAWVEKIYQQMKQADKSGQSLKGSNPGISATQRAARKALQYPTED